MKNIRYVAALLLALLWGGAASAQRRFVFDHLTVSQGLSQGAVNCILQDRQGFIWIGTQAGLGRYDAVFLTSATWNNCGANSIR